MERDNETEVSTWLLRLQSDVSLASPTFFTLLYCYFWHVIYVLFSEVTLNKNRLNGGTQSSKRVLPIFSCVPLKTWVSLSLECSNYLSSHYTFPTPKLCMQQSFKTGSCAACKTVSTSSLQSLRDGAAYRSLLWRYEEGEKKKKAEGNL